MVKLDKRLDAYRPDLADIALRGQVDAVKFVDGIKMSVCVPALALRAEPDVSFGFLTQSLLGDEVEVFEQKDGWAWVKMLKDGYVGYVDLSGLTEQYSAPTHQIKAPSTFIYPKPDLKSQPALRVFLNSYLTIVSSQGDWSELAQGGFIYTTHIAPLATVNLNNVESDPVAIAEKFINVPYLWGGNTSNGLDCSALVQQAYHACGLDCPRDSDMIESEIGEQGHNSLRRGDLVFWDGHIGMMTDAQNLIHANGHHMAVVVEDFKTAEQRINKTYGSRARFKRP